MVSSHGDAGGKIAYLIAVEQVPREDRARAVQELRVVIFHPDSPATSGMGSVRRLASRGVILTWLGS